MRDNGHRARVEDRLTLLERKLAEVLEIVKRRRRSHDAERWAEMLAALARIEAAQRAEAQARQERDRREPG